MGDAAMLGHEDAHVDVPNDRGITSREADVGGLEWSATRRDRCGGSEGALS
jgi:hypothetical protein